MSRLIALDLPGGPALVDAVVRAWDRGDAVLVLGRRQPPAARAQLLERARPHAVVGVDGQLRPADLEPVELGGQDRLVVASSGSSGVPKLVVHTEAALHAHARAVHRRLEVGDGDRWLACLPLDHLGGFGVVARSLLTGTPVTVLDGFDAAAVEAAPASCGATRVSLVPTALDRIDAGGFRTVVVGGAADPVARQPNVVRTYGLTETGGGVVYDGVPLDGVEVGATAEGAIRLRGACLARGVLDDRGRVVPLVDGDGWLTTGDLGRWEEGRLVVEGRADDLIVTGGENVWPGPVEDRLRSHPAVHDAAVVGVGDPTWGSRVVAVVVPADAARPPTLAELRAHVREVLAAPWAPRELQLVAALPRTALGKVPRAAVAADARRRAQPPPA